MTLRNITLQDCSETYVQWLNDPDINRYLETRWSIQNIDSIVEFVKKQIDSKDSYLFAIICDETNNHIGNIKIGPINFHYNHADISYFIGEKDFWGQGFATKAIDMACRFGFDALRLHKIGAGAYCKAIGSWKALEKNGFKREGEFREEVISDDDYMSVYRYGKLYTD